MSSLFAGIGAVAVQMLMKLIGYQFIAKVVIIGCKAWAETTQTSHDDQVVKAMADALGVDYGKLKEQIP